MNIKAPFSKFRETSPSSGESAPTLPETSNGHTTLLERQEVIVPTQEQLDARYLLADSIDQLQDPNASEAQKEAVRKVIAHDAEALAAEIIPLDEAVSLHLAGSEGINATQHDDERHPTIPEVFLLVHAYDATGDPKLGDTLQYIFATTPPALADELIIAYTRSRENNTPIWTEYLSTLNQREAALPSANDSEREFIRLMRRGSVLYNTEKSSPTGEDDPLERTGVQSA